MINAEFILTSLVVVLIPGTGVIYTISIGLVSGLRSSLAAAVGCTLGILPHLLVSILGLSALLHTSAVAFQVVKIAGAVYLLYLAWTMWRNTGSLMFDSSGEKERSVFKIIFKWIMVNILNPKLSIFFLAFLPQFVSPGAASYTGQMLKLSAIFMGLTVLIFMLYGVCADKVRSYIVNSPQRIKNIQRSFAVIFALLGLKLLATEQ